MRNIIIASMMLAGALAITWQVANLLSGRAEAQGSARAAQYAPPTLLQSSTTYR